MEALICLENISKTFDKTNFFGQVTNSVTACNNISFSIFKGETFGLVGESGSGKTTLGKIILGFEESTAGKIYIKGKDAKDTLGKKQTKNDMQIIFQDPYSALNPSLSALESVAEPLLMDQPRAKALAAAEAMLKQVAISGEDIHKKPAQFSGGQRQRIGIARAMVTNPQFVMCDEPVSALDVSIQAQILNLLMDLQDEYQLTYLFISHDLSIVRSISNRIGVMYLGNIVEIADTEELFRNPIHPYTKKLLAAIPKINFDEAHRKSDAAALDADSIYTTGIMTKINHSHYVLLEE